MKAKIEKDMIRLAAKMHHEDPDLYEVLKVILKKKDSMFHGSEEAKNFMVFVSFKAITVLIFVEFLVRSTNLRRERRFGCRTGQIHSRYRCQISTIEPTSKE